MRTFDHDGREFHTDSSISEIVEFPAVWASVEEDIHMEKINPYAFYKLGQELEPLTASGGTGGRILLRTVFFPLWNANRAMDRLLSGDPIKLGFSKTAAQSLKTEIESLFATYFADEKGEIRFPTTAEGQEEPTMWQWQWSQVTSALNTFQTVFQTEMENATTYQVSKKGLYSTVELVETAEEIFPGELGPYVPQKTKDDFHAAGRCLAFNLPTAAGFHAARGIEGQLELYWQTFTKKSGTLKGWQDYIDQLQQVIDAKAAPLPEQRTVRMLEVIKDYDRNPVMHPRAVVLSDVDARILFTSSESVIVAMAQEIKQATKGAGLVPMALVSTP